MIVELHDFTALLPSTSLAVAQVVSTSSPIEKTTGARDFSLQKKRRPRARTKNPTPRPSFFRDLRKALRWLGHLYHFDRVQHLVPSTEESAGEATAAKRRFGHWLRGRSHEYKFCIRQLHQLVYTACWKQPPSYAWHCHYRRYS